MDSTSIGLDVGSSAVRAVEISFGRSGRKLRRYGQVGLPAGAVVDGEVINAPIVGEALRRLWSETGFTTKKVVLGVSGHRVIVRQADVPALNEEDLRSHLRFDAQELIPIPMDDASFDFSILDTSARKDQDGKSVTRILIVAAHRDLLRSHLAALKEAGLEAVAIDAAPLALMRVVPPTTSGPGGGPGVEALVAIGAEMTTVAVRQNGVPRFIRSLAVGGSDLTSGIASLMHVDLGVAERLKRNGVSDGSGQVGQAQQAMTVALRDLAEDVRGTVDFFVGQSDGSAVERLLITGGASQTQGLSEALAGSINAEVQRIDPFTGLSVEALDLTDADLDRARASAATAVGLALWPLEPATTRLSILPDEVTAARRTRRLMMMAAAGVAVLVGLLGVAGAGQVLAVHKARTNALAAQGQVTTLKARVTALQKTTAVHGKVLARQQLVVTALTGDIDWVRVLAQLRAVVPPNLSVTSIASAHSVGASATAGTTGIATMTFSVTGSGGLPAVSAWLDGLQRDQDLQGTWVSGISVSSTGGTVTFGSTSNLTVRAESSRAKAVKQ